MNIILASGSPRRKEILEQVGILFTCIPSSKEEVMRDCPAQELVKELSLMKASDIAQQMSGEYVIIGADTVVYAMGRCMGKPGSTEQAFDMISLLQNNMHQVYTGVTILCMLPDGSQKMRNFSVETKVFVRAMTPLQIQAYVDTGEPMDKAGAYAIQGRFAPYIERIEGDYYNIVGFPIAAIVKEAMELGIDLLKKD